MVGFPRTLLGAAGLSLFMFGGAAVASAQEVRGVSDTEIVLGSYTDLSGVAASYGVPIANAMRLDVDEVNAAGGIHGRKIRLIIEDMQYQVPRAVQAANKLINRDNIFAMVGSMGTAMNNAIIGAQLEKGIPNLFAQTNARQMYEPFHKLKFAWAPSYYDMIRSGIKWMVETNGKKTVCAMYQDTDMGVEIFSGIQDQVKAMGLELAMVTTHRPTDTDFTAQILKLRDARCDLIATGMLVRDSITSYATARKFGWNNVDFIGTTGGYHEAVSGAEGGVTEGLYAISPHPIPYRPEASAAVVAWMDRYKSAFGTDPNVSAADTHLFMGLLIEALKRAGRDLTVDSLVAALESITDYEDIFSGARISFSSTKHQGSRASLVSQVKGGRWVKVNDSIDY